MRMNISDKILGKFADFIGQSSDFKEKKKPAKGLRLVLDTLKYSVYEYRFSSSKVIAAFGDVKVVQNFWNKKKLLIYPFCNQAMLRFQVRLDNKHFPGLLPDSEILLCRLIPYMREVDKNKYKKVVRLIIITTKSQIYHNYPARKSNVEGHSCFGDIVKFEESVVWDLPCRRYPSKNQECKGYECYYPNLPEGCYEYHPLPNSSKVFKDIYGNGGFPEYTIVKENGEEKIVSRFYLYSRNIQANPFHFMSSGESDYKMSIMATYRSNVHEGVRTCIFMSSDGGRSWYCKYEFADYGEYDFRQGDVDCWGKNFGNPILNIGYKSSDWNSVKLYKRNLCIPNGRECLERFRWDLVGNIRRVRDETPLIVETERPHGLHTGNIIALCSQNAMSSTNGWMMNNKIDSQSGGTGILFKADVIDASSIALYELVSSSENNIPCRHIHHVNRIKDGWMIGTGEIYPNGWIFYIQMKEADTYSIRQARDEFKMIRLNTQERSVQRTMGVILLDDNDGTLFYASDHDTLPREPISMPEEVEACTRGSTGIYKGKLSDLNDRNRFTCICDVREPCFYFQMLDGILLFCGQRGELAVSFDMGMSWEKERISDPIIHYYGNNGQIYYFNNCVFKRK